MGSSAPGSRAVASTRPVADEQNDHAISGEPGPELHTSYRHDNAFLGLCFSAVGSFGFSEPTNGPPRPSDWT